MNREALIIASSCNERYAFGLLVMACSVVLNNRTSEICFHIVEDGVSPETKEMILGKVASVAAAVGVNVQLHFIELSRIDMGAFPTMGGGYSTYARMFLPWLVEAASLYYVDADILCNRPFFPLREMEAIHEGKLLAGCLDEEASVQKDEVWTQASTNDIYLNTGFLWMNLDLLRKVDLSSHFNVENIIVDQMFRTSAHFHDQTLLNCICDGRKGVLPGNYNIMGAALHSGSELSLDDNWHFTGSDKPWLTAGTLRHLIVPFYQFYVMVQQLGMESFLPYTAPRLPLSRWQYAMRHFLAARLWFRSRKRFRRFKEDVLIYRYSKSTAARYHARLEGLGMK